MKKIILFLYLISGLISCKNKENKNTQFNWLKNIPVVKNSIPIVKNDSLISLELENKVTKEINISDLITNFSFLKLNPDKEKLIGSIDKILFNENFIFILDKYATVSLSIFDRKSGNFIFTIDNHGNGPKEFNSIYDFDIDYKNKFIYLFDGDRLRYLKYNFAGNFIESKRLPFRVGNVRRIRSGYFINFTQHTPNDHLGSFFSDKEIIITDSLMHPKYRGFSYKREVIKNDYYSRDYFSYNQDVFSYFPRFGKTIYILQRQQQKFNFKPLIQFNLGNYSVEKSDFLKDSQIFIKARRKDDKLFGNGKHFITSRWILASFESFKNGPLYVFYSKNKRKTYAGRKINFDFPGLPVFSFPSAVNKNECLSVVSSEMLNFFKNMTVAQKKYYVEKGLWSNKIEQLLNKIDDVESPVLLIYNLKKK